MSGHFGSVVDNRKMKSVDKKDIQDLILMKMTVIRRAFILEKETTKTIMELKTVTETTARFETSYSNICT